MAVWTLERLRTAGCSVHEAQSSDPNLALKVWRFPEELIFSLCWKVKENGLPPTAKDSSSRGSNRRMHLPARCRGRQAHEKYLSPLYVCAAGVR